MGIPLPTEKAPRGEAAGMSDLVTHESGPLCKELDVLSHGYSSCRIAIANLVGPVEGVDDVENEGSLYHLQRSQLPALFAFGWQPLLL